MRKRQIEKARVFGGTKRKGICLGWQQEEDLGVDLLGWRIKSGGQQVSRGV